MGIIAKGSFGTHHGHLDLSVLIQDGITRRNIADIVGQSQVDIAKFLNGELSPMVQFFSCTKEIRKEQE